VAYQQDDKHTLELVDAWSSPSNVSKCLNDELRRAYDQVNAGSNSFSKEGVAVSGTGAAFSSVSIEAVRS